MPTLRATREPLWLSGQGPPETQLDAARLSTFSSTGSLSLNGKMRSSVLAGQGAPTNIDWLEPPPGVDPIARKQAGLRIRTDDGETTAIVTPIELYDLGPGQLVRAVHYTLTLAIGTTQDWHILRWWLEPGGEDAALRADGLAFLHALHKPGALELTDLEGQRITEIRLMDEHQFDPELANAFRFITELAALEEWSGAKIPLPLEAPAPDVEEVSRAAGIVRARVVPMKIGSELKLTVGPNAGEVSGVDTLVLPREVWARPLGVEVALGTAEVVLAVDAAREEAGPQGQTVLHCHLKPSQPRSVYAHLHPPEGRSRHVRRTLVGGAPLPPDGLLSEMVARDLRQQALTNFLQAELMERQLDPEVLAEVEKKWPPE